MSRKGEVAAWVVAGLLALELGFAGVAKLSGAEPMASNFVQFGFPVWFRQFIGAAELAGAIGLLVPALRFYAAVGLSLILAGAIETHLTLKDTLAHTAPAVITFALLAGTAWARRPHLLRRAERAPVD